MDEEKEEGIDTTYVGIMVVVFLALAALAIDIGYLWVSDEDLLRAAETSSLEGTRAIKNRILGEIRTAPRNLSAVSSDQVQTAARTAAIDAAHGKHRDAALIEIADNGTNRFSNVNDLTVGFWDAATKTYTPGGTPVNAMQVRTHRTAESESVGLGALGSGLAKMSGTQTDNFAPEAIAAIPPMATTNLAVCEDSLEKACRYPEVCSVSERKMTQDSLDPSAPYRYVYTSLLHRISETTGLSDIICMDLPPQDVCGKQIFTSGDTKSHGLRDLESMMYNPNVDPFNKETDASGRITGWWVIVPVTPCPEARESGTVERRTVSRYALLRIKKICVQGVSGCSQNETSFKAPASFCGAEEGIYFDRLSHAECGSRDIVHFPGLRPVLVK